MFTCSSVEGMKAFIDRYASKHLLGVDFDIEGGQTQAGLNQLLETLAWMTTHLHESA